MPPNAGVISAYGLVASDYTKFDAVTRKMKLDDAAAKEAGRIFGEMRTRLAAQFADMKLPGDLVYTHTLDMRFVGQAFEVGVEVPADRLGSLDAAYLAELFADAHHRTFMHGATLDRPVEIVTLRVGATLPIGTAPKLDREMLAARAPEKARIFHGEGWIDCARYTAETLDGRPEDHGRRRHRRLYRHDLGAARLDSRAGRGRQSHPAENTMTALSPIDYAVISQALIASAREMGVKLIRSAYSTILREARDGSAGLMDRHGNTVAQAELIPMQLGPIGETLRACLRRHPVETLKEGDFLINNDPFEGGQHIPDVFIFTPIFVAGRVVGFGASVAHHLDLGGGAPGLNIHASDVYQEGLRFPPSKYDFQRDWNGGSFERLVTANVRVPDLTIGDFNAQFAANAIGVLARKTALRALWRGQGRSGDDGDAGLLRAPRAGRHRPGAQGHVLRRGCGRRRWPHRRSAGGEGQGHDRRGFGRDRLRGHLRAGQAQPQLPLLQHLVGGALVREVGADQPGHSLQRGHGAADPHQGALRLAA